MLWVGVSSTSRCELDLCAVWVTAQSLPRKGHSHSWTCFLPIISRTWRKVLRGEYLLCCPQCCPLGQIQGFWSLFKSYYPFHLRQTVECREDPLPSMFPVLEAIITNYIILYFLVSFLCHCIPISAPFYLDSSSIHRHWHWWGSIDLDTVQTYGKIQSYLTGLNRLKVRESILIQLGNADLDTRIIDLSKSQRKTIGKLRIDSRYPETQSSALAPRPSLAFVWRLTLALCNSS